jgi:hypothetical protein
MLPPWPMAMAPLFQEKKKGLDTIRNVLRLHGNAIRPSSHTSDLRLIAFPNEDQGTSPLYS